MDDSLPLYPQTQPQPKAMNYPKDNMIQPQASIAVVSQPQHQQAPLVLLGPENTVTTCPFCHASIKTAVKYTNTTRTHIAAALCAGLCCCCLPYSLDSAKNADHYCPNCQRYIGTYQK